jgi:DNA-binding NarL/FixJ family response regulator
MAGAVGSRTVVGNTGSHDACLIADDDEFFRLALRTVLLRDVDAGQVLEASSLDEALDQLSKAEQVSLAVFSLAMPGMRGASVLRSVREDYPNIRVVVASASTSRADMLEALSVGAHGFIPKGAGVGELSQALQAVRGGAIYVPSSIADISGESNSEQPTAARSDQNHSLTRRQHDVLELVVKGLSNKQIAAALGLGEGTVKVHVAAVFRVLGVTSRSAAAAEGARRLKR